MNYNTWLTKIMELKQELKTATSDIIKIISQFTFLFWLDIVKHINNKRIQFGETFHEEIENLCIELKSISNSEDYSQHIESTLKVCSDSINFIEGLENYVKIEDQGQAGSSSFNFSRSLTSTSTPKDVQINTNSQSKQKSTIRPDKQLTSNLFKNQQNIADELDISDSNDRDARIGNLLPPSVNQKVRRKCQNPAQYNYSTGNNTYNSSLNDNREQHELLWEQQMYNYQDLKDEITEKVTNHTNKLIDNIENKFRQINENIEKRQEEVIEIVFDKLERTLDNTNRQNNLRSENGNPNNERNSNNNNIQNTNIKNNRQQENRARRSNSITTEEKETTVTDPPLPFFKQLTSRSIHEEPQIEQNISSGSVPTTIRPFDGTDPAYTVEEYLNSIFAAMIFSSGIDPVNKPGHHQ